jgi:hypothetical protein
MATARGDLLPHDVVWLTPRTPAAPAICYRQPKAVVLRLDGPYVVVDVDGQEHQVHQDNVRRSNPNRVDERRGTSSKPAAAKEYDDVPLW